MEQEAPGGQRVNPGFAIRSEGGVENGKLYLTTDMDLKELNHNKVEGYDVKDLAFKLDAVVDQLNRLTLNQFLFKNPAGEQNSPCRASWMD